jgi:hypothetical protein
MTKPTKAPQKAALNAAPKFANEQAERAYWESQDSAAHLDWSQAQRLSLPKLKPSTQTSSLRLPLCR